MRVLSLALLVFSLGAAEPAKIFYSKSFPGSIPPYMSVGLDASGAAVYMESEDDPQPRAFQLEPGETAAIFALARKLDFFSRELESGLKVANMGIKAFRYEDGERKGSVKFNYSLDPDAQALADWFERITETALHSINLETKARFDHLGVDKALLQLQVSVERNRLAGAKQLLPVLDRIAKGGVYINRARERARSLADAIRAANQPQAQTQ